MIAPSETLGSAALLFEDLISGYLDDRFVERTWLARRVEGHLNDPGCRFVLLLGDPGSGKSAFMAGLARRGALSPRYFIRRLSTRPLVSGDAKSLLLIVGHQLALLRPEAMKLDLDVEATQDVGHVTASGKVVGVRVGELRASPFHRTAVQVEQRVRTAEGTVVGIEIERMVADPRMNDLGNLQALALLDPALRLARLDPAALIVVLIDAIDELRYQWRAFAGHGDIVEWLAQCPELPANVRVVVSSRQDQQLLQRFRLAQADMLREEQISSTSEEVFADLLVYAERLLADMALRPRLAARGSSPRLLARQIARRAEGNFLYLVMWGRALQHAQDRGDDDRVDALTDLSALPAGLEAIYEYFLVLLRDTVSLREGPGWRRTWNEMYRPLLAVLAVAQAPLTIKSLGLLTGHVHVAEALTDLAQFLDSDGQGTRLYHISLAEFLTNHSWSDWHVDAAESHYDVALRMIGQYGQSWETCEDGYALANTAIHLVASLLTAQSPELQSRSVNTLVDLLGDSDYPVAKATQIGTEEMLADYVAANAATQRHFASSLPGLAAGLADTMCRLAARDVPDLPDTLHAIVGYRLDAAKLNEAVLDLLTDPAYLARRIDSEDRLSEAVAGFSHGQATRLRRTGDPDDMQKARRILLRAASVAEETHDRSSAKRLSSLFYDLAYLDYLYGAHDEAARWFQRSIDAAEQAGDRTGATISRLVALHVELLRQAADPEVVRRIVTEALTFFQSDEARKPHAERWVMNCRAYLLDIAVMTGDAGAAQAAWEALEEDPWLQRFARSDLISLWQARTALVTGDTTRACELFEERLRGEITDPPPPREELARDLYDYGRALFASNNAREARRIWTLGLRCPDDAANWLWKPRITHELEIHPQITD